MFVFKREKDNKEVDRPFSKINVVLVFYHWDWIKNILADHGLHSFKERAEWNKKSYTQEHSEISYLNIDLNVLQIDAHELGVDLEDAITGSHELKLETIQSNWYNFDEHTVVNLKYIGQSMFTQKINFLIFGTIITVCYRIIQYFAVYIGIVSFSKMLKSHPTFMACSHGAYYAA